MLVATVAAVAAAALKSSLVNTTVGKSGGLRNRKKTGKSLQKTQEQKKKENYRNVGCHGNRIMKNVNKEKDMKRKT